jgi:hypothetical protein
MVFLLDIFLLLISMDSGDKFEVMTILIKFVSRVVNFRTGKVLCFCDSLEEFFVIFIDILFYIMEKGVLIRLLRLELRLLVFHDLFWLSRLVLICKRVSK